MTHLLLGELLASSLLADLVTLIVPTRCTITTIVFPLTTDTFAAPFPFLLHLFVHITATNLVNVHRTVSVHRMVRLVTARTGNGRHLARILRAAHLHITRGAITLRRTLQTAGPHFSSLLLAEVVTRRRTDTVQLLIESIVQAVVRVERRHRILELSGMQTDVLQLEGLLMVQRSQVARQLEVRVRLEDGHDRRG